MWEPRRLTTLWAFTACYRIALPFFIREAAYVSPLPDRIEGWANLSVVPVSPLSFNVDHGRQISSKSVRERERSCDYKTDISTEVANIVDYGQYRHRRAYHIVQSDRTTHRKHVLNDYRLSNSIWCRNYNQHTIIYFITTGLAPLLLVTNLFYAKLIWRKLNKWK
jgi:hypothetical protein